MAGLSEQLKQYLENTPKEQLEKEFFDLECEMYGINSSSSNAKCKLWWKKFKVKHLWKFFFWTDIMFIVGWFMCAGASIVRLRPLWSIIFCFVFGFVFIYRMIRKVANGDYKIYNWF